MKSTLDQSLNRHTDMVSLWNSTSAFNETNTDSNISKSINNDVVNVSDGIVNSNNTVNSVNSIPSSLSSVSSLLSSSTISTLPSPSSSTSSLKKTQSTKLMTNTLNSTVITTKNFSTFSSPSLPSLTTSNITTVDNATSVKSRNIKKEICLINTSLENRHHISDVVPAKPSGDNFEGILVNNNNISQCNNSNNIHCFYKSSLSDLAPVFIESQNGEVVRPFQYNNDTIVHFTTTNTDDINYDNSL
ncbi:unnamed protein product [Heterobilharzia americana]|nr:unnamed protein product [Heterobilharzia americana]